MSEGWQALDGAIAAARSAIAAEAPDADTLADGEAYVARMVTSALAAAFMAHRLTQGGLTTPLPVYGGPNPDYLMSHAQVDPTRRYRLEGRLNGSERVGVGLYTVGPNGVPSIAAYAAIDHGNADEAGAFALELAGDAQGPGTMAIPDGARILMIRVLHRDSSPPAQLALAGGPPQRGPTLAGGSAENALAHVARTVRGNVTEYMKWVNAARTLRNRLADAPAELADTVIGDADTQYFLGGYDLGDGEWLEIELSGELASPGGCYWSLHAYNFWYEHLVTPGIHDRNVVVDPDGVIRIAVGPTAPADAQNRIDTLGRRKGALVCRIVGHGRAIPPPRTTLRNGR